MFLLPMFLLFLLLVFLPPVFLLPQLPSMPYLPPMFHPFSCENPTALPAPDDDGDGVSPAVEEDQDMDVESEKDIPSTVEDVEWEEQQPEGPTALPAPNDDALRESENPTALSTPNDNDNGVGSAVKEHQDHHVGSEEDVPSTMQNTASEDLDSTSELTTLLDEEDNLEPSNNDALQIVLPKPSLHPCKRFKPHTSYTPRKVGYNWHLNINLKDLSESKLPMFVNDGNGVYLEMDQKVFEDLIKNSQPPHFYDPSTMSGTIPMDCTCFPASWLEAVMDNDKSMDILLEKVSIFSDRDRLHKSFDIRRLALHQGVDIHMGWEVHALYEHEERFPQYMTRWRLCATEGAPSRAHIDAGKFGTWIHMVHGTKLWVVISGDIVETSLEDLDYTAHKWTYYLLEPGDQLFMPAGTIHAVMTLNDYWVKGGHFYGQNSLHRSFSAGLREHHQGLTDCNTEHPESEYILHALLETYHGILLSYFPDIQQVGAEVCRDSNPRAYEEVLNHWPPLEELAYLLIMTGHAHHFEPEATEGETYHCSQVIIPTREKSLERIFSIFNFCPEIKNQCSFKHYGKYQKLS
ncbi:hypothetical protein BU17DRAFT_71757 [Hysterangium stoloniferum]|nr:hypothetical protein BU17DRAFT_71757 [Hysterangium stoloniferum]